MLTIKSVSVETSCPFCGSVTRLSLNWDDFTDWQDGTKLVQDAFPYLNADERELLMTGICSECWEKMFSNDEEEDDSPEWHDTCDQEEEEDYYANDWLGVFPDDEMGFNPYMGCYDYDC